MTIDIKGIWIGDDLWFEMYKDGEPFDLHKNPQDNPLLNMLFDEEIKQFMRERKLNILLSE